MARNGIHSCLPLRRRLPRMTMTEPVSLARSELGEGPPVYLLHGLYGSGRNLGTVARGISDRFRAVSLDLRNHGASPWSESMTYWSMAEDLAMAIEADRLGPARVVGHSMGGKAAMVLALRRPELVDRIAVVDIAPIRYSHDQRTLLRIMQGIDPDSIRSRMDANLLLAAVVPEEQVRGFLLQNLVRGDDTRFRWRINLSVIDKNMDHLLDFPDELRELSYGGSALAVSGARSAYVDDDGVAMLRMMFPSVEHVRLEGAGHLPHVEQPAEFLDVLRNFLSRSA